MNLLLVVLASLALPLAVNSDFSPCSNMTPECKPRMLQLKTILEYFFTSYRPPLSEIHNLKEELCQEARRCFSSCQNILMEYEKACEELRTHLYGLDTECILKVLEEFLEDGKCGQDYDFFTIDPSLKRKAYEDGKRCFLKTARFCILDEYYDITMDLYTIPPVVREKCDTPYDKFQMMQCQALLNYFPQKIQKMNGSKQFNATEITEYSKKCQNCIDNTCLMQPQKSEKWKLWSSGKKPIRV